MLVSLQPVNFSATKRKKLVKLQFPEGRFLNFENHHAQQTLLDSYGLNGVKENGEKVPQYAKVTLRLKPAENPTQKPHQLLFTITAQGEKLAKRLYREHFSSNPTVRAILRDERTPFKNWFVKRTYIINVDPKSLKVTVEPEKSLELMLDRKGKTSFTEQFKFRGGSSFGIDLLTFAQQVVQRATALKVLEPLK